MTKIPQSLQTGLKIPAIAAPMFLVSGCDLVVETCKAGMIGTFPALNCRTSVQFEKWLIEIKTRLADFEDQGNVPAKFGVNLIVHKTNKRLQDDLALCIKHQVPLVITSLGAAGQVVSAIHAYGGIVFHDIIKARHGRRAVAAGVDGLILVAAGAGGHSGTTSPFALVAEAQKIFEGPLILAGAISTGRDIAAARMIGADMAYLGTRFIATREAMAVEAHKQMIINSGAEDILATDKVSGISANFLKESLDIAGIDINTTAVPEKISLENETRAWVDAWSAGHGVSAIDDLPTVENLVAQLIVQYRDARLIL